MRKLLLIAFLASAGQCVWAQKVENVRAAAAGDDIIITYDLAAGKPEQKFKIQLFGSHNNFSSAVLQVSGDVGDNVSPGKDRQITWHARTELLNYKGNLTFEVHADLILPVVTQPTDSQYAIRDPGSVKRGGNLEIHWTGGPSSENVKLELVKDNVPQQAITNSRNSGSYSWSVPGDTKPGAYQVRLTGPSGTALSPSFAIKHKVPTALKILPVVVIVGVAASAGGGGGGGGGGTTGSTNLPEPPKVTD